MRGLKFVERAPRVVRELRQTLGEGSEVVIALDQRGGLYFHTEHQRRNRPERDEQVGKPSSN